MVTLDMIYKRYDESTRNDLFSVLNNPSTPYMVLTNKQGIYLPTNKLPSDLPYRIVLMQLPTNIGQNYIFYRNSLENNDIKSPCSKCIFLGYYCLRHSPSIHNLVRPMCFYSKVLGVKDFDDINNIPVFKV